MHVRQCTPVSMHGCSARGLRTILQTSWCHARRAQDVFMSTEHADCVGACACTACLGVLRRIPSVYGILCPPVLGASKAAEALFAAQDVATPVERPADMIAHLRNMPAEEIARKQEALRVARSRLFYMALPHSHGPTGADVLTQHMCRRAGRVPPVDAAVQRTLQRHGAVPSQTVPSE